MCVRERERGRLNSTHGGEYIQDTFFSQRKIHFSFSHFRTLSGNDTFSPSFSGRQAVKSAPLSFPKSHCTRKAAPFLPLFASFSLSLSLSLCIIVQVLLFRCQHCFVLTRSCKETAFSDANEGWSSRSSTWKAQNMALVLGP